MIVIAFIIAVTTGHSNEFSLTEKDYAEMRQGLIRWEEIAQRSTPQGEDRDKYIELLGSGIRKTEKTNIYQVEGRENTLALLKSRLLQIPGHAIYFRDRIDESRRRREEGWLNRSDDYGLLLENMRQERSWGFKTLENLPSVETVSVLGEFLSHELGEVVPAEIDREIGISPNSRLAVSALSRLGIANPPTPPMVHSGNVDEGLEAWRVWYQQVKDGRRTFRFIGDPVDYDLRGPSKRGAVEPLVRNDKRASNGVKILKAEGAETTVSQRFKIFYAIAAFATLVGAFFTFRKKTSND